MLILGGIVIGHSTLDTPVHVVYFVMQYRYFMSCKLVNRVCLWVREGPGSQPQSTLSC